MASRLSDRAARFFPPKADLFGALAVLAFSLLVLRAALPVDDADILIWGLGLNPAVNYACTGEFAEIDAIPPQLDAFLNRRQNRFDCLALATKSGDGVANPFAEFALAGKPGTLNAYADGIPYFLRGLGFYWSLTGVSWSALTPVIGGLFVIGGLLVYLLFREFMGAAVACACACLYLDSPANFYLLRWYEHYAKVPIALAIILLMTALIRHRVSSRMFFGAALLGGVILGIGFGVRADLWLLNVPFLGVLLVFAPASVSLLRRIAASLAFILVAAICALPALRQEGASYFWLQLVEGLATPFDDAMGLRRTVYERMPAYNDVLGINWLRTDAFYELEGGKPDDIDRIAAAPSGQPPEPPGWQELDAAGEQAYLRLVRYFPADFIIRPLAATLRIIAQSFAAQPGYLGNGSAAANPFVASMRPVWVFLGRFGDAIPYFLAVELFALALVRRREALFFALLVLFAGGATGIVFIDRHSAYLYFIGFLTLGIAVNGMLVASWQVVRPGSRLRANLIERHRLRTATAAALKTAALCVGWIAAGAAALIAAIAVQQRAVGNLIETMLSADRERLSLSQQAAAAGEILLTTPGLIEQFRHLASRSANFEYGYYFLAAFSRAHCAETPHVGLSYEASNPYYADSRLVDLAFDRGSDIFYLIFPAYYMKTPEHSAFFKGIDLPAAKPDCLVELDRFRAPQDLPFLINWRIQENWTGMPLYQRLVPPWPW